MASSSNAEWDTLRRNVRTTENELDQRIASYSRLASQQSSAYYSSSSSSSSGARGSRGSDKSNQDACNLETEIGDMLDGLSKMVDEMTTLLDKRGTASTSAMSHGLVRHREILRDYRRDYERTRTQIRENDARMNLLGSVRDEISQFRSNQAGGGPDGSDSDMLLAERNRIDNSHRMTDEVLEQAYATRHEFSQQRGAISNVNARMSGVISQVPGINSLLSMINSRRRRESFILSCVAAVCSLILLWYVFG